MTELYTVIQENIETGTQRIVALHIASTAMRQYLETYTDETHRLLIHLWKPAKMKEGGCGCE